MTIESVKAPECTLPPHDWGEWGIREVADPQAPHGSRRVLIQVRSCSTCGLSQRTDL